MSLTYLIKCVDDIVKCLSKREIDFYLRIDRWAKKAHHAKFGIQARKPRTCRGKRTR